MPQAISTSYQVRSLALQPLSAGNSAEISEANNSRTTQRRGKNLTSLDSSVPVNRFMYTPNP